MCIRDRDYCRIAIGFFHDNKIPFWEMENYDALVGNEDHKPGRFCFAKKGETYVVFLPGGKDSENANKLDLNGGIGELTVKWFNPRSGGDLQDGSVKTVAAGNRVDLGSPPSDAKEDWVVLIRK